MIQRTMIAVLLAFSGSSLAFGQGVVQVLADMTYNRDAQATGSGVWLDELHVLTAAHVILESTNVRVVWDEEDIPATVEEVNMEYDWALLKTKKTTGVPVPPIRQKPLEENEQVTSYGWGPVEIDADFHPMPRVLRKYAGRYTAGKIEGSVLPQYGDSGGPIFDKDGKLVGVINVVHEANKDILPPRVQRQKPNWRGSGMGKLREFLIEKRGFRWAK